MGPTANQPPDSKMKEAIDETSDMIRGQNPEEVNPSTSCVPGEKKEEPEKQRAKRIRFAEPPKEEKSRSSSNETSEEESDSSSEENTNSKTVTKEISTEESDSSSEEISLSKSKESKTSQEEECSSDSGRKNIVSISVHQEVEESLKPPKVAKPHGHTQLERESSSEKEPSSTDDSEESPPYLKLHNSPPEVDSHSLEVKQEATDIVEVQEPCLEVVSNVPSEAKIQKRKKSQDPCNRIFEKVPNQNAVYVPLHGSSDEEQSEEDRDSDQTAASVEKPSEQIRQYNQAPNEYSILVPLHGKPDENLESENKQESEKIFATKDLSKNEHREENITPDTLVEGETVQPIKVKKRKPRMFFKVPNEDAVVIPLHGSSDEENYEVDTVQSGPVQEEAETTEDKKPFTTKEQAEERKIEEDDEPNKYAVIVPLHKSPFEKSQEELPYINNEEETGDKKISQNTNSSLNPEEEEIKKMPKKVKHRIFTKVPNQNAVFVPLHGSSDEEESSTNESDIAEALRENVERNSVPEPSKLKKSHHNTYAEAPNKYSVFVPLHGLPGEEIPIEKDTLENEAQANEPTDSNLAKISSDEKSSQNTEPDKTEKSVIHKKRLFLKVPGQNAVIVPLHGSSDEEDRQDVEEDDGLNSTLQTTPSREVNYQQERKSSKHLDNREVIYEGAPNEYGILVPLSGFPDENVSSSEGVENSVDSSAVEINLQETENPIEEGSKNEDLEEEDASTTKIKKKQRVFLKVPNQNAVFVPLHGSSDEEEILESPQTDDSGGRSGSICETPKIQTIQRIYSGAPNEYAIFVPLHGCPDEQGMGTQEERIQLSETSNIESSGISEENRKAKVNVMDKDISTKVISKIPEQNAALIPLQGISHKEETKIIDDDDDGLVQPCTTSSEETKSSVNRPIREKEPEGSKDKVSKSSEPQISHASGEESRSKTKKIKKERLFVKIPNQNAVIVPLHGSSDEEEKVGSCEDDEVNEPVNKDLLHDSGHNKGTRHLIKEKVEIEYNQAPNEYGILIPLHGLPGEELLNEKNVPEVGGTHGRNSPVPINTSENQTSQLEQTDSKVTDEEILEPKKHKPRLFYKIPNENAFLVPLHGSSDEEEEGGNLNGSAKSSQSMPGEVEKEQNTERMIDYETPNEYGIIVPLHRFPYEPKSYEEEQKSSLEPSILSNVTEKVITDKTTEISEDDNEKEMNKKPDKKKKQRIFLKVPNQDAVFVPLHGSSDEEEKIIEEEEPREAPISTTGESLSIKTAEGSAESKKHRKLKTEYTGAPNEYAIFVPLHGPEEDKSPESQPDMSAALIDTVISEVTEVKEQNNQDKSPVETIEAKSKESVSRIISSENDVKSKLDEKYEEQNIPKSIPEKISEPVKPKINQRKVKKKIPTEEKEITTTKSDSVEKSSKVTPVTKEKVTVKKTQMPFKMADAVLQLMSKKEEPVLEASSQPRTLQKVTDDETNKTEIHPPEEKPSQAGEIQKNTCDHEYEPIQAPRSASQPPDSGRNYATETRSHPVEVITRAPEAKKEVIEPRSHPVEVNSKREEEDRYEIVRPQEVPSVQETSANLQVEGGYEIVEEPKKQEPKRYIRIPNEDAIIVPLHGSSDEELNPDRYLNPALMMSEEEIERLPQKMSFNEAPQENPKEKNKTHDSIQQKFKTQTDRLTTKLKGISKPNINLHKPNIKLPERPNIKMPDIPKIKLPDRPKFSLPDTSKFHLPERPKFHFPERPKFHMPERPKFLSERPKFKLPERPKFSRGEKKPKGPKGKKPNPSSLRRPLRDVVTISSQSTPGSTHNIFETLKFRTYPRFFKKKKTPTVQKMSSLDTESSQPSTPPTRPRSYSGQQQDTSWVHAYRDVKFADEDSNLRVERMEEEYEKEENIAPFHENYDGRVRDMVEEEFKQGKAESMTSVASEKGSSGSSSNRRRAGVIEEIDSDEFFVREKGLSREDVDVSRYLSLEIRDAFRQPKNALASLDSELYDDEEPEIKYEHSPRAPQRTRPRKSGSFEQEQEFHTFPKRPSRRKESDPEIVVKPPRRFHSASKSGSRYRNRQSSMPSLNSDIDMGAPEPPRRKSRERSIKSLNREGQVSYHGDDNVQNRVSAQHSVEILPVAPLRKSRSRGTSLADDDRTSRGADSAILPDDDDLHHPNQVDREDMDLEIMEDNEEIKEESIEEEPYKEVESATIKETIQVEEKITDYSGYAVVSKDKKKPPRPPPPPHQHFHFQSQLDSIKNTGKQIFFTYPRRAIKSLHKQPPARPVRNYSTLGPVRPPRKNRVFRQPLYMTGDNMGQQDSFVDKERDLQSGDVVNRMKGRPLPPPPRPPRKTKDLDHFIGTDTVEDIPTETIIATTEIEVEKEFEPEFEDRLSYIKSKKDKFLSTLSKYSPFSADEKEESTKEELTQTSGGQTTTGQQTSFDYGDVSIQTDPLPKGCIIIDQEIEETEEIIILPDNSKESSEHKEEKSTISEESAKIRSAKLQESKALESIQKKEEERESPETNIFQHALERVEAARGVLKEARERVTPGSTSSLDERRPVEEKESPVVRVSQREALPTSERSDEVEKEGTPPPLPYRPLYTKPIPVSFPDKLHLSELDVDTLNVSEIQANKIKVSEIESTCIEVTELTSRGGNLTLNGVELPPDFISNIVAQVAAQQAQQQQAQSQQLRLSRESTPQRQMRRVLTPPPSILVHATSESVTLPEPKQSGTDGTEHIPQPKITKSKGRKLQTRVIDDSEDELASTLTQRRDKEQESKKKSEEPSESRPDDSLGPRLTQASSVQLMRRLFSIWQEHVVQGTGIFVQGVNSLFPEGEKRRDAQIAAFILLILITGLILVGFGFDNSVHHHHWDYLPPR